MVDLDEVTLPVIETVSEPAGEEPVIENLDEAKRVEEHAAEIEVAPVAAGSNVEVGTEPIAPADEYSKKPCHVILGAC